MLRSAAALPVLLVVLGLLASPLSLRTAAAQSQVPTAHADSRAAKHLEYGGVNVLLGGLTSGILGAVNGEEFWRSFLTGAVGGGAIYLGKAVSVRTFAGAGLLGRQIGSVGASVIRSSARGDPPLDEIVLPAGPVRFYLGDGEEGRSLRPKVDLVQSFVIASMVLSDDASFDPGASVSSGAPVFEHEGDPHRAISGAGALLVPRENASGEIGREVLLTHERVHIVQYDQVFLSWGDPLERALLGDGDVGSWIYEHTDIGLAAGLPAILNPMIDYEDRPWEQEAMFLTDPLHDRYRQRQIAPD